MSDSNGATETFVESQYLESNPDIREAVQRGDFRSGFEHYQIFGRWEGRPGAPRVPDLTEVRFKNPVPPPALRLRVHGSENLTEFELFGKAVADQIWATACLHVALDANTRALDFGCGCGRVMNYFSRLFPGKLNGADIDPEAISWCQNNLPLVGGFVKNHEEPPLPYPDESFDLVYSISVFTHLPQGMEDRWLRELTRVATPGSLLLLTIHGEDLLPAESPDQARLKSEGFLWSEGRGTAGLPSFYQTSFHRAEYIRERWGPVFEIEAIEPKTIVGLQDLVVCRKRLRGV